MRKILIWLSVAAFVIFVVMGFGVTRLASIVTGMPLNMEPERVSHFDPNAIPAGVRKDLPPITDRDGKRDAFFYPDGMLKGRVVYMRFPQNYVSAIEGALPPRHSDSFVFGVIYPAMVSIIDPAVVDEMNKEGGYLLDGQIEVGIGKPTPGYLADQVKRYLEQVDETKRKYPDIKYEELPVPAEFRTDGCHDCRARRVREIIEYDGDPSIGRAGRVEVTDTYIEWGAAGDVTREMTCFMDRPRPTCGIEIGASRLNPLYMLSINFHAKYLSQLHGIVDRVSRLFVSSVVKVY